MSAAAQPQRLHERSLRVWRSTTRIPVLEPLSLRRQPSECLRLRANRLVMTIVVAALSPMRARRQLDKAQSAPGEPSWEPFSADCLLTGVDVEGLGNGFVAGSPDASGRLRTACGDLRIRRLGVRVLPSALREAPGVSGEPPMWGGGRSFPCDGACGALDQVVLTPGVSRSRYVSPDSFPTSYRRRVGPR
jgi:hypothetical protein